MPGLLDLPPELLDELAQYLLFYWDRTHMASFRLSCRYVEKATRYSFLLGRFSSVMIAEPKEADVRKFCAMTKIPDLAKSIKRIGISCANDITIEPETLSLQQRKGFRLIKGVRRLCAMARNRHFAQILNCIGICRSDQLDRPGSMHSSLRLVHIGQPVPKTLIRHEEAFLAALVSAESVTELDFTAYKDRNASPFA
jgi:hypothetical protein